MSHYKPYSAYKESGVEWLGLVPDHWTIGPYKATIQIENGSDYKEVEADDGYPVIGSGGPFAFASKLMYDGESVLLGRKGTIDKPLYVNGAFWAVDTMYWSIIKPGAHGRFAYYIATTIPFDMYSTNTALPSMTKSVLGSHTVAFPRFDEQRSIAAHLDRETARIDGLVQKKTRFIELLREKRQELITHAVTKGLDPHAKMKDSGVEWLGEVPEHWGLAPLKRVVSSISQGWSPECEARTPDSGEWGVVKVGCVNGGVFRPEESKALPAQLEPRPELGLMKGDVLVSRANTRELVGSCAVVPRDYPYLLLCDKLYRIGCSARVTPDFLAALIAVYGRRAVEVEATGASSSMVNIAQSVILDLLVAFPSKQEQDEIICRVSDTTTRIDNLRAKTEHSITLLKERRSALITAAVTGQIDLREAV